MAICMLMYIIMIKNYNQNVNLVDIKNWHKINIILLRAHLHWHVTIYANHGGCLAHIEVKLAH